MTRPHWHHNIVGAFVLGLFIVGASWIQNGAAQENSSVLPPGTVIAYSGRGTPGGFLVADGRTLPPTDPTFAALCAALGNRFNRPSDDAGVCRLPDLQGRVPVGAAPGRRELGAAYGEDAVRLPQHNHGLSFVVYSFRGSAGPLMQSRDNAIVAGFPYVPNHGSDPAAVVARGEAQTLTVANAGEANVTNAQPSLVIRYLVKI